MRVRDRNISQMLLRYSIDTYIFKRNNIFYTDVHLLLELLLSKTMFLGIIRFHNTIAVQK